MLLATRSGLFTGVPSEKAWESLAPTKELVLSDLVFADKKEEGLYLAADSGVFYLDLPGATLDRRAGIWMVSRGNDRRRSAVGRKVVP